MTKSCGHIIIIAILLLCNITTALCQSHNSLSISSNQLVLQIDLNSSKKSLDSILNIAGEGTSNTDRIMKGDFSSLEKDGWVKGSRQNNLVRFERSLSAISENPQNSPYEITLRLPQIEGKPGYPAEVQYGVNKFSNATVYGLSSGLTRFILPGFTNAKRVFLSGNFNSWSTLQGVMKKADGGWIIDIKLDPGVYQYKYIIGGHWATDPNNLITADDGAGNTNSVFYKYNYTFKLKGYGSAHKVILEGDFNKWDENELVMEKKGDDWEKQLYLGEGKHEYRFLIDGNWITDPANPLKEKGDNGNLNSILKLGETVYFKLKGYADAKQVFVTGDFNKWKQDELSLKKTNDGWALPFVLSKGNYGYKFIVDGKWINDPENSNYIVEDGQNNSFLSVKPNYTFKLEGYSGAKIVKLAGSFNNWDPNGFALNHKGNEWIISFYLKPGKYLYKFIVDGQWMRDPANKFWENDDSHDNSILWIE